MNNNYNCLDITFYTRMQILVSSSFKHSNIQLSNTPFRCSDPKIRLAIVNVTVMAYVSKLIEFSYKNMKA